MLRPAARPAGSPAAASGAGTNAGSPTSVPGSCQICSQGGPEDSLLIRPWTEEEASVQLWHARHGPRKPACAHAHAQHAQLACTVRCCVSNLATALCALVGRTEQAPHTYLHAAGRRKEPGARASGCAWQRTLWVAAGLDSSPRHAGGAQRPASAGSVVVPRTTRHSALPSRLACAAGRAAAG